MKTAFIGLAAATVVASAVAASADTISFEGPKYGGYQTVNTSARGNQSAGEFQLSNEDTGKTLFGYCIDLFDTINGQADYGVLTPGSRIVTALEGLFTNHYSKVNDRLTSAAFQLSVWEIVYEEDDLAQSPYSLETGDFTSSRSTNEDAWDLSEDWLADLGYTNSGYSLSFWDGTAESSQDLVTATPVPVPAAGVLLVVGLGALGAVARRRNRA